MRSPVGTSSLPFAPREQSYSSVRFPQRETKTCIRVQDSSSIFVTWVFQSIPGKEMIKDITDWCAGGIPLSQLQCYSKQGVLVYDGCTSSHLARYECVLDTKNWGHGFQSGLCLCRVRVPVPSAYTSVLHSGRSGIPGAYDAFLQAAAEKVGR
jgi:hypothetical protein